MSGNWVENAYDLFTEYVKQGKIKAGYFEDKSGRQSEWWYAGCEKDARLWI